MIKIFLYQPKPGTIPLLPGVTIDLLDATGTASVMCDFDE